MSVPELTPDERAAGWRLLFDGTSLAGWRAHKSLAPPNGWAARDGVLSWTHSSGDLMTVEQFADFELALDWRISPGGNSGIIFRVTEDGERTWETGPEMQVLDNDAHASRTTPLTIAGANYALHAPVRDVTRPVGEWNSVRLQVLGAHVTHWMNGVRLLDYELWSADWDARVAASKFATLPGYGRARRGHIVLQDHDSAVDYRDVKIRVGRFS